MTAPCEARDTRGWCKRGHTGRASCRCAPRCANRLDRDHEEHVPPSEEWRGLPVPRFGDAANVKTIAVSHSCKGVRKEPTPRRAMFAGAVPCCFPSPPCTVHSGLPSLKRMSPPPPLSAPSRSPSENITSTSQPATCNAPPQAPRQRRRIHEAVLAMPSRCTGWRSGSSHPLFPSHACRRRDPHRFLKIVPKIASGLPATHVLCLSEWFERTEFRH